MTRIASEDLSKPFTYIYNEPIKTGVVPDIFKISQVTPVYKNGLITEPRNYQLTAVLSLFSSSKQVTQEVTDKLKEAIDKKKISCGVFLDLSKAFDTVNHEILLSKLYAYRIRGLPLCWFKANINI